MKICPVGTELLHAGGRTDGRTDMTKLTAAFRNFANASKNSAGSRGDIQSTHIFREHLFASLTVFGIIKQTGADPPDFILILRNFLIPENST
jgi:hypothetical protein